MKFSMGVILLSLALTVSAAKMTQAADIKVINTNAAAVFNNNVRRIAIVDMIPEFAGETASVRTQMLCLAMNIYFEAAISNEDDRWAVGHVTRNRLKAGTFGKDYCDVVWSRRITVQFSWTNVKQTDLLGDVQNSIWAQAQRMAFLLYSDPELPDPTSGRTVFWNPEFSTSDWVNTNTRDRKRIGQHIYARPKVIEVAETR